VVEGEGREKGPYSIKTCEKEAFYVIFEKLPLFEWNEQRCAIIWALDSGRKVPAQSPII
jgi:hypothetical protein